MFQFRLISNLFTILLSCLVISITYTQPNAIKLEDLSSENSLPSLRISSLIEDRKGFIWIGTDAGLARFDGYRYKIYTNDPNDSTSLNSNQINHIYLDREGILWIATRFGFNKYEKATDKFTSYNLKKYIDSEFPEDHRFFSIFEDSQNRFWVLVFDPYEAPVVFNKEKGVYERVNDVVKDSLVNKLIGTRFIFKDSNNNLWFVTFNNGIVKLDILTGKLSHYEGNSRYPDGFPRINGVPRIISRDSKLWVGFGSGLSKLITVSLGDASNFSPESVEFIYYPKSRLGIDDTITSIITKIIEDKRSTIWIGTDRGLCFMDSKNEKFYKYKNETDNAISSFGTSIKDIFEDKKGIIWVATEKGIRVFKSKTKNFLLYDYGKIENKETDFDKITSISEDSKGNLWLASGGYLIKWDREKGMMNKYSPDSLGTRKFRRFFVDSQNIHWLTCQNSNVLRKYNLQKNEINNYYRHLDVTGTGGMTINEIFEDTEGLLWMSTIDGLCCFGIDRSLLRRFMHDDKNPESISNSYVKKIYEDTNGKIWVSTLTGLDRLDKKSGIFEHFRNSVNDSTSLSNNDVTSFYDDGKGYLWMTTYGGGLNMFDKQSEKFICINENHGFASNFMHNVLSDNHGNLWISSNKGISRFNTSSRSVNNYNTLDGLQEGEFGVVAFKSKTGEMFFGGENGLNVFHPDSVKDNMNVPPVVLISFRIYNQEAKLERSISETDEIRLSYSDNFFSIAFSALDYTNPIKNQYMYMLEGIDKDWVRTPASKREASYTDIDPGEYIFRVKGSNNDGKWNEEGVFVKIIIKPPWWQTWWFRGSGIILVIGLLGYSRHRKLSKIKEDMQRQTEFTKQLINTQEKERKRIAGELHDSLGQNLLIIKNKALLGRKDPEKNPELIEEISELTSSTLQEVREISYDLHPYQLERLGLTKAIESIIDKCAKSTGINFSKRIDHIDKLLVPEIEINLFRIIQECISNIIKHSNSKEVEFIIKKEKDQITVIIKDNGSGFNIAEIMGANLHRGIGLMSLSERAKLCGGKAEIESLSGVGTTVRIYLPIN